VEGDEEKMNELTEKEKAIGRRLCREGEHGNWVYYFFGYVYCGRCGEQIGDRLASLFPSDTVAVISCDTPVRKCPNCYAAWKKMTKYDRELFTKQRRRYRRK